MKRKEIYVYCLVTKKEREKSKQKLQKIMVRVAWFKSVKLVVPGDTHLSLCIFLHFHYVGGEKVKISVMKS